MPLHAYINLLKLMCFEYPVVELDAGLRVCACQPAVDLCS